MSHVETYPPVTEELLAEAVRRILAVGSPEKIVLFGSRARGDAKPDSDIDLLVIEETELPKWERGLKYRHSLRGLYPEIHLLVHTPEEVDDWSEVPNYITIVALREGRTLYERAVEMSD